MILSKIGFSVTAKIERAAAEAVAGFQEGKISTPNVADVMGRFRATGGAMCSIAGSEIHLVGTAFTVRTPPADNLMVHKAMDLAQAGDVIVVEAGGDMSHAILGELMCVYAQTRGIAGFVVDGPVRDGAAIRALSYPVFAKGLAPRGPHKEGPGEINVTISCGGLSVSPGDVIVGDADGVAVVPRGNAEEVAAAAGQVQRGEAETIQQIHDGWWRRDWVDETLLRKGCELDGHGNSQGA